MEGRGGVPRVVGSCQKCGCSSIGAFLTAGRFFPRNVAVRPAVTVTTFHLAFQRGVIVTVPLSTCSSTVPLFSFSTQKVVPRAPKATQAARSVHVLTRSRSAPKTCVTLDQMRPSSKVKRNSDSRFGSFELRAAVELERRPFRDVHA